MMDLLNNADEPELDAEPAEIRQQRTDLLRQINSLQDEITTAIFDETNPVDAGVRDAYQEWRKQQIDAAVDWQAVKPSE